MGTRSTTSRLSSRPSKHHQTPSYEYASWLPTTTTARPNSQGRSAPAACSGDLLAEIYPIRTAILDEPLPLALPAVEMGIQEEQSWRMVLPHAPNSSRDDRRCRKPRTLAKQTRRTPSPEHTFMTKKIVMLLRFIGNSMVISKVDTVRTYRNFLAIEKL